MDNTKEFGKLAHDQFSQLVSSLPEVRRQMHELPELLKRKKDRLAEVFGDGCVSWGTIYEFSFIEQLSLLFILTGLHVPFVDIAKSDDPHEAALAWSDHDGPMDQWLDAYEDKIEKKHLIWLAIVIQRNILAIMLYHKSMGALVDLVRKGNDHALFDAVRVDRSVLLAAPCADRLSRAELLNDKDFLRHLRSAIKGPTKKHMAAIQDLRYSIIALRESGFDRFSDADLERLFVKTGVYPNSAGALKNLRKHIQQARKLTTT